MPLRVGSSRSPLMARALQPVAQAVERGMARQVHLQRRDRDEAIRHGVKVRAGTGVLRGARGTDPVDLAAAWIEAVDRRLRAMAVAEARDFEALQLLVWAGPAH